MILPIRREGSLSSFSPATHEGATSRASDMTTPTFPNFNISELLLARLSKGRSADSEEKHEPVSDSDTTAAG